MGPQTSQNRNFYILMVGIFFVHAGLMLTQISTVKLSQWSSPKAIKLRIIQEAMQDLALQPKKQIVQSEDSSNNEKTKDAFLSDKDRSFERETRAKSIESFKQAAKGNSTATNLPQHASASRKKADLNKLKLSDMGIESGDPLPQKVSRSPASATTKGVENGDPLSQGLSATNDYVEEVALGDFTHLNTVEYKFYGFFHRIRQKLEQFWGKSIQEKSEALFRSGRRLPASENLTTSLQVTLNEKGEIIGVRVLGASGVRELDDAAIESFNQAGPFPNPPKELLVNGKATIEWGFVVKS